VFNDGMAKQEAVSDQLREATRASAKSRYRISVETGIAQSILSRFLNQGAGLSMENIDRLCACLGARLVMESDKKAAAPKRKRESE
jgi:hypothetical protein